MERTSVYEIRDIVHEFGEHLGDTPSTRTSRVGYETRINGIFRKVWKENGRRAGEDDSCKVVEVAKYVAPLVMLEQGEGGG